MSLKALLFGTGMFVLPFFGMTLISKTADAIVPLETIQNWQTFEKPDKLATEERETGVSLNSEFAAKNLNPQRAYVYLKALDNLRFEDCHTTEITVKESADNGNTELQYNRQSGKGSPNIMRSFFPSSAGTFEPTGGFPEYHPFYRNCGSAPELLGSIVAAVNNHIRTTDENEKIDFDTLKSDAILFKYGSIQETKNTFESMKQDLDNFKTVVDTNSTKKWVEIVNVAKEQEINIENLTKQLKKIKLSFKNIFGFNDTYKKFNEIYTCFTEKIAPIENTGLALDKIDSSESLATILYILQNAQYMIENQKTDGSLPQDIFGTIVTAFALMKFDNGEQFKDYQEEAVKRLSKDTPITRTTNENNKKLAECIKAIHKIPISPYSQPLSQNCPCKIIKITSAAAPQATTDSAVKMQKGEPSKTKTATFGYKVEDSTFPDCVEAAVFHTVVLSSYSDVNKYKFFTADVDRQKLKDNWVKISYAIKTNGNISPELGVIQFLRAFFYNIEVNGADCTDIVTRTAWNFIVSNMNNPYLLAAYPGLYRINYNRNENELLPGILNYLKVI